MEGLKRNIVIMDFSGIYQEEQFYEGEQISWIDLSDISGTNCYCDGDAQAQILERMEKYPVSGIYFIDSGNYHYMSRIGIGRVKEPFNLLVFDNHTDMQLPAFGGLLSCGGWIASALEVAEKTHQIKIICHDIATDTITLLKKGIVDFALGQNPVQQGYQLVKTLFEYLIKNICPPENIEIPITIATDESL